MDLEKAEKIVELTEQGMSRPEIAVAVNLNKVIVWKYQKRLDLI